MTPRTNYSKWWQFQNWWVVDVSANIRMFTHSISINSASTSLCHSSKENALNFSRFYEDKWEIKRNEVVCSYWWWKSNLLCPFRVSSSLFFIGKVTFMAFAQLCTLNIIKRGSLFMWDLILCWVDTFSGDSLLLDPRSVKAAALQNHNCPTSFCLHDKWTAKTPWPKRKIDVIYQLCELVTLMIPKILLWTWTPLSV